eukprot:TRINITY_DN10870_c0_g1_i1.p1 TRINITY_DN10870_c0_g1~~TRINITY_DN10870_c0_g1_i1.p1  ORF type:complete len:308 (-),score=40.52 TRINITY_DN10870_c0_g1_i1:65-988(-)
MEIRKIMLYVIIVGWGLSSYSGWDVFRQQRLGQPSKDNKRLYINNVQGIGLRYYSAPQASPKGFVIFSHSYGDSAGQYIDILKKLNSDGLAVYTFDHQGHGKSYGMRHYVETFDNMVDDLIDFTEVIVKNFDKERKLPVFLVGEFTGAAVATMASRKYPNRYSGVISISPPLYNSYNEYVHPYIYSIAKLLDSYQPKMPLLPFNKDTFYFPLSKIDITDTIRIRVVHEGVNMLNKFNAFVPKITFPHLLIHGRNDTRVPHANAEIAFNKIISNDKKMVTVDGSQNLLKGRQKNQIITEISNWIGERI